YRAAGDLIRPATVLPERYHSHHDICNSADRGLLASLEQLAHGGQLDEARKVCEELGQTSGPGGVGLLSRILAAAAWQRIGEIDRGKALIAEVIQRLEN